MREARDIEYWLGLNLSRPRGSLALHASHGDGLETLATMSIGTQNNQSELFIPTLIEVLKSQELDLGDVDRFLMPSGPGSFTGLRIAFASMKAFFMARKKPLEVLSGAECRLLAWNDADPTKSEKMQEAWVLSHATLDKFVISEFRKSAKGWDPVGERMGEAGTLDTKDADLVLLDERLPSLQLESKRDLLQEALSLEAPFLGASLMRAKSRRTCESLAEMISLSPQYFGTSKFENR